MSTDALEMEMPKKAIKYLNVHSVEVLAKKSKRTVF
jgi:hypothetical protein